MMAHAKGNGWGETFILDLTPLLETSPIVILPLLINYYNKEIQSKLLWRKNIKSFLFMASRGSGFAEKMDSALSHLLCLFLLLLPLPAMTQTNIRLGMSLSTSRNSLWLSPSGEFAFGFYPHPPTNDTYLLAIWFDKIPDKTIIWSANGDNPAQLGSKVQLTNDGRLVLINHQGQEIWKANTRNSNITSAAMLDTGNFVLISNNTSDSAWESFAWPTDTILPGQVLRRGGKLSSRLIDNNSNRRFELHLQEDGKVMLYYQDRPTRSVTGSVDMGPGNAYWQSETVGSGSDLVFNESGRIYLKNDRNDPLDITPKDFDPMEDVYLRATLDSDSIFRQYATPKASQGSWKQEWLIMPPDPCMTLNMETGSGVCGFNSYCEFSKEKKQECKCPPGYSYLKPKDPFGGCKQDFSVQACRLDQSRLLNSFELVEMINVDWPLSDFEHYSSASEEQCKRACLEDCFCAVAIYRVSGDCWKKKLPLSNGRMNSQVDRKAFIKVLKSDSCREDKETVILTGSLLIGTSVFLNLLFLSAISMAVFFSYHKKLFQFHQDSILSGRNLRSFSYRELEEATDGFKEELGRGAFGPVYKGILASDSRNIVAIKKLDKVLQDGEREFRTEVSTIGQTHHKNLVRLLGFCDEGTHRLLVYEYMSNGSLASLLFKGPTPGWNQRMQIAISIARGLSYLHEECRTQIIHCDIKPQNILLDDFLTPKISDFGLAKLLKTDQTRTLTGIRGTKGYVAAEWFKTVPITAKVDVFSFGVVLLEIVCCRKNVELGLQDEEKAILTDWAYDCYGEGRLDMLVEKDEEVLDDYKRLERLVMVAIWCIQEDPSLRPSMKRVTEMMEGVVEVAVPPDPSL
ncbi:G-type lectin S-receptor-like serine/threonine-protein kinase LECRK3 [Magnolia sinica]|uniref:G-type lectin S-receptor-like serine/threonine-protein kinase LECRK3 n=1 Tax=Magnolia sinica TaxID=86752 RepID=UPI0026588EF5|nr:G-type lectin S-receptor-like serine/threonine-protein kinase LECRK3 [Magnolia sinica]